MSIRMAVGWLHGTIGEDASVSMTLPNHGVRSPYVGALVNIAYTSSIVERTCELFAMIAATS